MHRLTYIASPYSHLDEGVRNHRASEAQRLCAWMRGFNMHPVSPIAHWHEIVTKCQMANDAEAWADYNRVLFDACGSICILAIQGWKDSAGMAMELDWARRTGKPIMVALPSADRYELRTGPAAVAWLEGQLT